MQVYKTLIPATQPRIVFSGFDGKESYGLVIGNKIGNSVPILTRNGFQVIATAKNTQPLLDYNLANEAVMYTEKGIYSNPRRTAWNINKLWNCKDLLDYDYPIPKLKAGARLWVSFYSNGQIREITNTKPSININTTGYIELKPQARFRETNEKVFNEMRQIMETKLVRVPAGENLFEIVVGEANNAPSKFITEDLDIFNLLLSQYKYLEKDTEQVEATQLPQELEDKATEPVRKEPSFRIQVDSGQDSIHEDEMTARIIYKLTKAKDLKDEEVAYLQSESFEIKNHSNRLRLIQEAVENKAARNFTEWAYLGRSKTILKGLTHIELVGLNNYVQERGESQDRFANGLKENDELKRLLASFEKADAQLRTPA